MLLQGSQDIKKYLPSIALKDDLPVFDDAIAIEEDDVRRHVLGDALYAQLEGDGIDDAPLRGYVKRVIALAAFLSAMPDMDVTLTDAGFAVVSTDSLAPASKQRMDNLAASIGRRLDKARDDLMEYLFDSTSYDAVWRNADIYDDVAGGLIHSMRDMRRHFIATPLTSENMPSDWTAFALRRPNFHYALHGAVARRLGEAFVTQLVEDVRRRGVLTDSYKEILRLVKCAVVTCALGDSRHGDEIMDRAVAAVKTDIGSYPDVAAYLASNSVTVTHTDRPIY
jgi:hypothetical protein